MDVTRVGCVVRAAMLAAVAGMGCGTDPPPVVAAPIEAPIAAAPSAHARTGTPLASPAEGELGIATDETASGRVVKRPRTTAHQQQAPKDCCMGKNECKGKSGCVTKATCGAMAHSCAGQNQCKGTGTSCPPGGTPNP